MAHRVRCFTAVPVAVAVGAVVLHHPGAAVSWLLPALACTLCVTAASTWYDPVRPAAFVALGWTGVIIAWQVRDTPWAITTASAPSSSQSPSRSALRCFSTVASRATRPRPPSAEPEGGTRAHHRPRLYT